MFGAVREEPHGRREKEMWFGEIRRRLTNGRGFSRGSNSLWVLVSVASLEEEFKLNAGENDEETKKSSIH